ncbi:MAG: hypothetical protein NTY04_04615, partial [Candidatus Staskawiczbacteria bacterium]|nr:hypothetical protein [Candidatus Staskawiczbacteria bacterium]
MFKKSARCVAGHVISGEQIYSFTVTTTGPIEDFISVGVTTGIRIKMCHGKREVSLNGNHDIIKRAIFLFLGDMFSAKPKGVDREDGVLE